MSKINEISLLKQYTTAANDLKKITDGRWWFAFNHGKVEVWDALTNQSISMTSEDIPRFRKALDYLEGK